MLLVPRDLTQKQHPVALRPFLPEIQEMIEFTHKRVMNEVQKYVIICLVPMNKLKTDVGSCLLA